MSDSALIAALAARLRQASENGQAVAPIAAELPAGSLDTAYAIQNHNTEHALAQGRRLVGR
ncbi:MAG: hypothetical protein L6Q58_15075, partial [Rivicola pingtungensis]|nr:hypothetical protein [Rivihabitans pingtungensis]